MTDAPAGVPRSSVVPVLRYRDLPAAIDWLCRAFGFERHRVTAGKDGAILFAQLTFGTAMVMVGPVRRSAFDRYLRQPDEIGGAETQVCYFSVEDAHAHCARARAAGAEILFDIEDSINRGRSYSCRDPEGHLWNFGTYDPWRERSVAAVSRDRPARTPRRVAKRLALVAALLAAAALVVLPMVLPFDVARGLRRMVPGDSQAGASPEALVDQARGELEARAIAEQAHAVAQARLKRALAALSKARGAAAAAREQLRVARGEKETSDRAADGVRSLLAQAQGEKLAAERAVREVLDQLAQARQEKEDAERAAKAAWDHALKVGIAKSVAQRAAREARRQLARERSTRAPLSSESIIPPPRWE